MSEKIIALVDGSAYSASVCDHAAWIASRSGAAVELLHVLGRREGGDTHDLSGTLALGARSALMQELAELDAQRSKLVAQRGRAILDDAHALLTRAGVADITTRLRHGDIVETVAEIEHDASLILIGKRGEAADFASGHLGSNLERIVRASTQPVLVAARAFKPVQKVLVAYDGGASALKAVDHITRSPVFEGLQITLATVGPCSAAATQALEHARALLQSAGRKAEALILEGQPETLLGQMVDRDGFDMVIMGAYGHSRIRSLMIGSTTTEMLRSCKVCMLLLR